MNEQQKAFYEDAVYPETWDLPTPPAKIRIPEGYDESNPAHVAALQETYSKAYNPVELNQNALTYLADIKSQGQRVAAQTQAVQSALKELETVQRDKYVPVAGGRFERPRMSAEEAARYGLAVAKAKEKLSAAEADLTAANKPIEPKVFEVQLPQPQAQETKPEEAPKQAQAGLPSKASAEGVGVSDQEKWYRGELDRLGKWTQQQIAGGADPSKVRAAREMYMADIESQWIPEIKRYGGKTWRVDLPNKHVEVSNDAAAVKEPFTHSVQKATDQIANVDQINEMINAAERAARTTNRSERNALIAGLQNSFKAITTGISGTSDAVQQQEFARANAPLDSWNLIKSLDPNSLTKFGRTNPQGFADMLKAVRNISVTKAAKHYVTAEDIAKEFPMYKPSLPQIPDYMAETMNRGIIQKGQPSQQDQGKSATSAGGAGYIIRKTK